MTRIRTPWPRILVIVVITGNVVAAPAGAGLPWTHDQHGTPPVTAVQRAAVVVNAVVRPFVASSLGRRLVGGTLTLVTYRGRRSGKVVTIPVGYVHRGDEVSIGVELPDQKVWWRNFTGDGHPIAIRLDGVDRTGHAVAERADDGRVHIAVALDPEPAATR
ncbi:MAG TPA: nitroreductase/quinone reductase family protein [Actinomycetospora sp.]|uniref:nitroreductase/quinone reductase family protein n=1 Tax=Actinomycetospora sp. TaxID=1872135 RepID=UPI002F40B389